MPKQPKTKAKSKPSKSANAPKEAAVIPSPSGLRASSRTVNAKVAEIASNHVVPPQISVAPITVNNTDPRMHRPNPTAYRAVPYPTANITSHTPDNVPLRSSFHGKQNSAQYRPTSLSKQVVREGPPHIRSTADAILAHKQIYPPSTVASVAHKHIVIKPLKIASLPKARAAPKLTIDVGRILAPLPKERKSASTDHLSALWSPIDKFDFSLALSLPTAFSSPIVNYPLQSPIARSAEEANSIKLEGARKHYLQISHSAPAIPKLAHQAHHAVPTPMGVTQGAVKQTVYRAKNAPDMYRPPQWQVGNIAGPLDNPYRNNQTAARSFAPSAEK